MKLKYIFLTFVAFIALGFTSCEDNKDITLLDLSLIHILWFVDIMGFKSNQNQFVVSGVLSVLLFLYTFTLPKCPVSKHHEATSLVDAFGLRAFSLFKDKHMAIFFIFSMLLDVYKRQPPLLSK